LNVFIHSADIYTRQPRSGLQAKLLSAMQPRAGHHEYKAAEGHMLITPELITPDMEIAAVAIALIGYAGYREWLRHQRRALIHRERLAAIEKGVDLPPLEQEVKRRSWNVQRTLLLAGLIWVSLGLCAFVTLSVAIGSAANAKLEIPHGVQWLGLAPILIGASHLVVYLAGKKKEDRDEEKR
jgi:hypothetical protein